MKSRLRKGMQAVVATAVVLGAVFGGATAAEAQTLTVKKGSSAAPNCKKDIQIVYTTPVTYYVWGRAGSKTKYTGELWVYQSQVGWISTADVYRYTC
ncbi:hypothetical protein [Curtobacterium citreum]|uniref:hypothetical protein n=1 Tax=Curtobacterium citreum TaxID=2036 RepID=UPI000B1895BD|nr:hypothetical protein [Curtobacterium citreum]